MYHLASAALISGNFTRNRNSAICFNCQQTVSPLMPQMILTV